MLYASKTAQQNLASLGHYFNPTKTLEDKLGLAASNYEMTSALPEIVEYFGGSDSSSFFNEISAHEERLANVLLDYLNSRKDVTVYGEKASDPAVRVPTISFNIQGWGSRDLVERVERDSDFGFRWGHFYSKRLCDEILQAGDDGVIRVSMVCSTRAETLKRFD